MAKKKAVQHINISEIKGPEFLADLSYKELKVLSKDISEYIVDVVSRNGGHLASNLGVVDSTIALFRVFDFKKDKIVFDVGHQCYTYKILTGRSLERLRKKDGVSGFQKMRESPYDHFEAGHSSTSISVVSGMALARDLKNEKYETIAFIGDASIANGLAFEGLNLGAQSGNKMIIILNDNDMSIKKPAGALAKTFRKLSNSALYRRSKHTYQRVLKRNAFGRGVLRVTGNIKYWFKRHLVQLNVFDMIGYSYVGPVDGHDIKELEKAFSKAKKMQSSVVVHVKTLKGKGYAPSENDDSGKWHGVGKFEVETGEFIKKPGLVSWSSQYADELMKVMDEHKEAFLIVPATETGSALTGIFDKYPERCQDVGISEEHAFTFSGGLAVSGYHPVISIYSTFLQRAYDELSHDLARMNLNATVLIDRSGLVGADGETHQGIYDEQFLIGIPNTVIAMASRQSEAKALLEESFKNHGVFCIRYPRGSFLPREEKEELCSYGKWKVELLNSSETAIVSVGPATLDLKDYIISNNLKATLYNAIYLKPMDDMAIHNLLKYNRVIIYDTYATVKGFATQLAARLMELRYQGEVIIKSIPDTFVKTGSVFEQMQQYSLTIEDIAKLL